MKYDWNDKVLRASAVEWAAREIGMPPRRGESGYSAWSAAAAGAAAVLDLPTGASGLESMMRDPMLRPEGLRVMSDIEGDETRIAQAVEEEWPGDVLVVGHPYVDVWQAIRPATAGIDAWPVVGPGQPWRDRI